MFLYALQTHPAKDETILLANRQLYFFPSPPTHLLCTKTQDRLRLYQTAITTISKQLIALLLVWFCMKKKLYPKPAELETHFFGESTQSSC